MKTTKQLTALVLILLTIMVLTGCGPSNEEISKKRRIDSCEVEIAKGKKMVEDAILNFHRKIIEQAIKPTKK